MSWTNAVRTTLNTAISSATAMTGAGSIVLNTAAAPYKDPVAPASGLVSFVVLKDFRSDPTKVELFSYTGVTDGGATKTLTGVRRALGGFTAQDFSVGAVAEQALNATTLSALAMVDLAVNYARLTSAQTGNPAKVSAFGTDTNVSLQIAAQAAGVIQLLSNLDANSKAVLNLARCTWDEPNTFTNTGASYAIDMTSAQDIIRLNINQATTLSASNIERGRKKEVIIQNTTPFTITWDSTIGWGTAGAPASTNGRRIVLSGWSSSRVHAAQEGSGGFNLT